MVEIPLAAAVSLHRIEAELERRDPLRAVGAADRGMHRALDGERGGLDQLRPVVDPVEHVEVGDAARVGDGDERVELPVVLDRERDPLLVRQRPEDLGRDGAAEVGVELGETLVEHRAECIHRTNRRVGATLGASAARRGGVQIVVRRLAGLLAVVAAVCASGAAAATTGSDGNGTVLLDGAKTFPIVLAKGPEPGTTTPSGRNALAEVASAGATYLKIGPATVAWTDADIEDAKQQNQAAAANNLHTWVNLSTVSRATAGSAGDELLERVVTELESDAGGAAIGMWKGADEPLWSRIAPSALQFAYCRATGRGDASWCGGEPVLDTDHAWVTIQAPRGTASELAPYTPVTDIHGVDVYPVTLTAPAPNLHDVGTWTSTIASVTPSRAVWTTLQVCASGSYDSSGRFVLPTFAQERYMLYDAILNGARSIAFYGGNNPNCWNASDSQFGWNWSFWSSVLKPLLGEINSLSPLAPALVNPATTQTLPANDATTQAISRQGNSGDLWVIAARHGAGTAHVTIGGLPAAVSTGTVYTEGRSISRLERFLHRRFRPVGRPCLPLRS